MIFLSFNFLSDVHLTKKLKDKKSNEDIRGYFTGDVG